jgi:hypothetical protein
MRGAKTRKSPQVTRSSVHCIHLTHLCRNSLHQEQLVLHGEGDSGNQDEEKRDGVASQNGMVLLFDCDTRNFDPSSAPNMPYFYGDSRGLRIRHQFSVNLIHLIDVIDVD